MALLSYPFKGAIECIYPVFELVLCVLCVVIPSCVVLRIRRREFPDAAGQYVGLRHIL